MSPFLPTPVTTKSHRHQLRASPCIIQLLANYRTNNIVQLRLYYKAGGTSIRIIRWDIRSHLQWHIDISELILLYIVVIYVAYMSSTYRTGQSTALWVYDRCIFRQPEDTISSPPLDLY